METDEKRGTKKNIFVDKSALFSSVSSPCIASDRMHYYFLSSFLTDLSSRCALTRCVPFQALKLLAAEFRRIRAPDMSAWHFDRISAGCRTAPSSQKVRRETNWNDVFFVSKYVTHPSIGSYRTVGYCTNSITGFDTEHAIPSHIKHHERRRDNLKSSKSQTHNSVCSGSSPAGIANETTVVKKLSARSC